MFLRKAPKYLGTNPNETISASAPSLSARSLFRWLGQTYLANFILLLPLTVCVLCGLILASIHWWGVLLFLVIIVAVIVVFIRLAYAFMLVSPIAVLQKGTAFKESYRMTNGYKWKIFWNYLVIMIVFTIGNLLFSLPFIVSDQIQNLDSNDILSTVVSIACSILALVAVNIYSCMVYAAIKAKDTRPK